MKRALILLLVTHSLVADRRFQRDWEKYPAVAELPHFTGTLLVSGDVHGTYGKYVKLLLKAGVVTRDGDNKVGWAAGDSVFVQLGDVIDKGEHSLPVLDLLMSLQKQAPGAGGRVIVVAGNHEMAFLEDPIGKKAKLFQEEIEKQGLDVMLDVYSPSTKYGEWFRDLPAAALINGIYLSHSGWAGAQSVDGISREFREAVDTEKWDDAFTCGDHEANPPTAGFFNANVWWGDDGEELDAQLGRLHARQVIFGHDPKAFGKKGEMIGYFGDDAGRALIKADVGLVKGDSDGMLYRCRSWLAGGGCREAEVLDAGERARFRRLKVVPHRPEPDDDPHEARPGC